MTEDCYFFVDPDPKVPEEERTMKTICVECRDEHMSDTGWFYPGATEGYGPYDYQCCKCRKFVCKADDKDKANEEETETAS